MSLMTKFERWDPFDELSTLRNRMDRLWTRFGDERPLADWAPTSDVIEAKDELIIQCELPGIEEKNIGIEIEAGVLTIRGERKAETESEEKGYRRVERSYGTFLRSFTLPPNVDTEKIAARFDKGVLEVHMPKKESAKPRSIKVEVKKQLATAA